MATQVVHGKGFEWAVAVAAKEQLGITLINSDEARHAASCYSELPTAKQQAFRACAEKAVAYVADIEHL